VALRAELLGIRQSLTALLGEIDRISAAEPPARTVRIDRVTPAAPGVKERVVEAAPHLSKPVQR
jgi:hypothetical protein